MRYRYPVEGNVRQRYPVYVCEGRARKRKIAGQNRERLSGSVCVTRDLKRPQEAYCVQSYED